MIALKILFLLWMSQCLSCTNRRQRLCKQAGQILDNGSFISITKRQRKYVCSSDFVSNIPDLEKLTFKCSFERKSDSYEWRATLTGSESIYLHNVSCEQKKKCSDPPLPRNMTREITTRYQIPVSIKSDRKAINDFYTGDTLTYICKPGFTLLSDRDTSSFFNKPPQLSTTAAPATVSVLKEITCDAEGFWNGFPDSQLYFGECQAIQCNASMYADISNGKISNFKATYEFLDEMKLECRDGYRHKGAVKSAVCMTPSSFSNLFLSGFGCERIKCIELESPGNGYLRIDHNYVNGTVTYECESGYDLIGHPVWKCQSNGQWDHDCVKCAHEDAYCQPPCLPPGAMTKTSSGKYQIGDILEFSCKSGNYYGGSTNRTCMKNRYWSGTPIDCTGTSMVDFRVGIEIALAMKQISENRTKRDTAISKTINIWNRKGVDIYLLVDISKVLTPEKMNTTLSFVYALLPELGINDGDTGTRLELTFFGTKPFRMFEQHTKSDEWEGPFKSYKDVIKELEHYNNKNVLHYIRQITNDGTEIAAALNDVYDQIKTKLERSKHRKGRNSQQVLIFISDGKFTTTEDPTYSALKLKRDFDVEIYSIAIGDLTDTKGLETMRKLASHIENEQHFFKVSTGKCSLAGHRYWPYMQYLDSKGNTLDKNIYIEPNERIEVLCVEGYELYIERKNEYVDEFTTTCRYGSFDKEKHNFPVCRERRCFFYPHLEPGTCFVQDDKGNCKRKRFYIQSGSSVQIRCEKGYTLWMSRKEVKNQETITCNKGSYLDFICTANTCKIPEVKNIEPLPKHIYKHTEEVTYKCKEGYWFSKNKLGKPQIFSLKSKCNFGIWTTHIPKACEADLEWCRMDKPYTEYKQEDGSEFTSIISSRTYVWMSCEFGYAFYNNKGHLLPSPQKRQCVQGQIKDAPTCTEAKCSLASHPYWPFMQYLDSRGNVLDKERYIEPNERVEVHCSKGYKLFAEIDQEYIDEFTTTCRYGSFDKENDKFPVCHEKTRNDEYNQGVDVFLLVDISTSITLEKEKIDTTFDILFTLLPELGISDGDTGTRLALTFFGLNPFRIVDHHLIDQSWAFTSHEEAMEEIRSMKEGLEEITRITNHGSAIKAALDDVYNQIGTKLVKFRNGMGRNSKQVLIIISDGRFTTKGDPTDAASRLKNDFDVEIYSFAIGDQTDTIAFYTMSNLASQVDHEQHFFQISNAESVLNMDFSSLLNKGKLTCGLTKPHLTSISNVQESMYEVDTKPNAWPWIVELQATNSHRCSGSLIHDGWILTAASCVNQMRNVYWRNNVMKEQMYYEYWILPRHIYQHPKYDDTLHPQGIYDIALVQLERKINRANNLLPVCLWDKNFQDENKVIYEKLFEKTYGVATCWNNARRLKQYQMEVKSSKECLESLTNAEKTYFNNDLMFCAGGKENIKGRTQIISTCCNDSGSPFVVRHPLEANKFIQIGIVSFWSGCKEDGRYVFFTKLTEELLDWIDKTIEEMDEVY